MRRSWPNQLQITINEQHAVARWQDQYLINDKGQLFQPDNIPEQLSQQLVKLVGPGNTYQYLFARYQELQPLFSGKYSSVQSDSQKERSEHSLLITEVFLNERRALGVELSNGMQIKFGRINASVDMYSAAGRFLRAYENGLIEQTDRISVVDLRYTNGFAVQWKKPEGGKSAK